MNTGAFGEQFPYTNFHNLNMDWIVKIAKDFLDQYTNIQQTISDGVDSINSTIEQGETSIGNLTEEELESLASKYTELEGLLDAWYTQHSEDIANALASAVSDLTSAGTTALNTFQSQASAYGETVIESIPADYSDVSNASKAINENTNENTPQSAWNFFYKYGYFNSNFEWTENSGIATLKIPLQYYEFVSILDI